jgi:hypothetical protein
VEVKIIIPLNCCSNYFRTMDKKRVVDCTIRGKDRSYLCHRKQIEAAFLDEFVKDAKPLLIQYCEVNLDGNVLTRKVPIEDVVVPGVRVLYYVLKGP